MGARRLISGTGSKRFTGARRVKNVGKRTRSGPMETVRPGKRRSDSLEVSSREIEKISLSHDAKQVRYTCNIVIRIHESHIFVLRKIHFKQMKIIAVYTQLKQLRNKA